MATLIPSIATCKFDSPGERRFARLLEAKLEDDYLCWFNVPIGPARLHPDFIILHPQRGILILEVKDWRVSTIQSINTHDATIYVNNSPMTSATDLTYIDLALLPDNSGIGWVSWYHKFSGDQINVHYLSLTEKKA